MSVCMAKVRLVLYKKIPPSESELLNLQAKD